jgi:NAD(P)-dependent dehydrogenase (short-subunit alcohol dehydrogenase family)
MPAFRWEGTVSISIVAPENDHVNIEMCAQLRVMLWGQRHSRKPAKSVSNIPLSRLCEADDVANACLSLASDEVRLVTSMNMEVDGRRAV